MTNAAVPRFDLVTIDCPRPAAAGQLLRRAAQWPVPAGDGDYVALDHPAAARPSRSSGPQPSWPRRGPTPPCSSAAHLDLAVDDLDAAHERAVTLGARHLDAGEVPGLRRPGRSPFCLCSW